MVSYTEQTAYRERNRNRRSVVLQGTIESGDAAANVALTAGNASLASIDHADVEESVINGTIYSYNRSNDQIDLLDEDLSDNSDDLTGDNFIVTVTGPVE